MFQNKFIGWSAFTLFVLATSIMILLVFYPAIERFRIITPGAGVLVAAILGLMAIITGIPAFKTPQGKVAMIGGLVLVGVLVGVLAIFML